MFMVFHIFLRHISEIPPVLFMFHSDIPRADNAPHKCFRISGQLFKKFGLAQWNTFLRRWMITRSVKLWVLAPLEKSDGPRTALRARLLLSKSFRNPTSPPRKMPNNRYGRKSQLRELLIIPTL
jgi:hypothetical protein